jgi:hypothetical protein
MAKDTVKIDETSAIEKRLTRLEAVLRMIQAELKAHFGIETKGGNMHIGLMVLIMLASLVVANISFGATATVVDWSTGVSDPIGTAKITTDGTDATLTINKIVGLYTGTITNFTVTGRLAVTGATTNTGTTTMIGALTANNVTINTNLIVGAKVTSYGYPVGLTGTNGDGSVYLTQFATNDMRGTTQTNTFAVSFIAVPAVAYQANNGVMTNILAVASNQFTSAGTANAGSYIAVGRIK